MEEAGTTGSAQLQDLPNEILAIIIDLFTSEETTTFADLCRLKLVCSRWSEIVETTERIVTFKYDHALFLARQASNQKAQGKAKGRGAKQEGKQRKQGASWLVDMVEARKGKTKFQGFILCNWPQFVYNPHLTKILTITGSTLRTLVLDNCTSLESDKVKIDALLKQCPGLTHLVANLKLNSEKNPPFVSKERLLDILECRKEGLIRLESNTLHTSLEFVQKLSRHCLELVIHGRPKLIWLNRQDILMQEDCRPCLFEHEMYNSITPKVLVYDLDNGKNSLVAAHSGYVSPFKLSMIRYEVIDYSLDGFLSLVDMRTYKCRDDLRLASRVATRMRYKPPLAQLPQELRKLLADKQELASKCPTASTQLKARVYVSVLRASHEQTDEGGDNAGHEVVLCAWDRLEE